MRQDHNLLSIVGLLPAAARIVGGSIEFEGEELTTSGRERCGASAPQDRDDPAGPDGSLNPLFSIYWQVAEPAYHHQGMRGRSLWQRVRDLLAVGSHPLTEVRMREYPHQMSGGMPSASSARSPWRGTEADHRRRATTNLDVTIQAQYLDVLKDIQHESGVALIFVTHNLGIVAKMCDKMAVMYAGKIVEQGSVRDLFRAAKHPYTQALLGSMPKLGSKEPLYAIRASPPKSAQLPPGCAFHPRCAYAMRNAARRSPPTTASLRIGRRGAGCSISRQRKSMARATAELQDLQKYFPVKTGTVLWRKVGWVKAVDGVNFAIYPGETLGLIGDLDAARRRHRS